MFSFVPCSLRGDLSALGVTGPQSGTGFANIGAVAKTAINTSMSNADVLIEIQSKSGDDLLATCTASFDFDTEISKTSQTLLVAFPVTGFGGEAVKITHFEVVVDGVQKPNPQELTLRLFSGSDDPKLFEKWTAVESSLDGSELLGFRLFRGSPRDFTLFQGYTWSQEFVAGTHSRVAIRYSLVLHPQSLAYAKRYLHGESRNIVPFDAMWVGESDRTAFFLDYILRSGATWKGPIGHEKVTLKVAASSGLTLDCEEVITFGRHLFSDNDDLRDSVARVRAGVGAESVRISDSIVWEIDHEKPQQDILVEIPVSAVKNASNAKPPPATGDVSHPR
jgi:hypothetical protein